MNSCWPNPIQKDLLKACLLDGSTALKAWHSWKENAPLNKLDTGSLRLLPLLYLNLKDHLGEDPQIEDLKQHYVTTWIQNEFQFKGLTLILGKLQDKGFEPLVLKGTPLIELAYNGDIGARPMTDIDVLIKPSDLLGVEKELLINGWKPTQGLPSTLQESKHATPFENNRQLCLDLHWRFSQEIALHEKDVWHDLLGIKLNGFPMLAPSIENILFNIIIHGVRWSPAPPIRWCADAYLLIKKNQNNLNWKKFLCMAKDNELSLSVYNALNYLKTELSCPIPEPVLEECREEKKSLFEVSEYHVKTNRFGGFFAQWFRYSRLNQDKPWFLHWFYFIIFLMHNWNINTVFHLPEEIYNRVMRRLKSH